MNLFDAIYTRRTIKDFTDQPVPDDLLHKALDAGRWAQNQSKILTKPRIVAVTCALCGDKEIEQEDYAAVACAVQNIQLAAWELGLGMQWGSSRFTTAPATYAALGVDPGREMIVGLLYFGFPAAVPAVKPRKALTEIVRTLA